MRFLLLTLCLLLNSCIYIGDFTYVNVKSDIELNKIYHESRLEVLKDSPDSNMPCQLIANKVINKLFKAGYQRDRLYWISGRNLDTKFYHRAVVVETLSGFKLLDWPLVTELKDNNNSGMLTWWQVKRFDKIMQPYQKCRVEDGKLIILR